MNNNTFIFTTIRNFLTSSLPRGKRAINSRKLPIYKTVFISVRGALRQQIANIRACKCSNVPSERHCFNHGWEELFDADLSPRGRSHHRHPVIRIYNRLIQYMIIRCMRHSFTKFFWLFGKYIFKQVSFQIAQSFKMPSHTVIYFTQVKNRSPHYL